MLNAFRLAQNHLRSRFAMESCRQALTEFEQKFPVSFAVELDQLHEQKLALTAADNRAASSTSISSTSSKSRQPSSTKRRGFVGVGGGGAGAARRNSIPQPPIAVRLGIRRSTTGGRTAPSSSGGGKAGVMAGRDRTAASGKKLSGESEKSEKQSAVISDEADSYKKMRRQTYYRECSRHFIRYFTDAGTLFFCLEVQKPLIFSWIAHCYVEV